MASNSMRYQKAAVALRSNLKRRKAQARARADVGRDRPDQDQEPQHSAPTPELVISSRNP